MAKFDVRYVHKVSQTCVCGCSQYSHRRPPTPEDGPAYLGDVKRDSPVWGQGACTSARCAAEPVGDYDGTKPCLEFKHESQVMEIDDAYAGVASIAEMLRKLIAAKVVTGDTKLRELRLEADGRLIIIPDNSLWSSIVITPILAPEKESQ
jgi:hypothetical protein